MMRKEKDPAMSRTNSLTNAQARAFYRVIDAYIERTGTLWATMCDAVGCHRSLRSVVNNQGKGMHPLTHAKLQLLMDENPRGIFLPDQKKREFLGTEATQQLAAEIRAYLARTGTECASVSLRAGRDAQSLQNLLDRPHKVSPIVAQRYRDIMAKHPDGFPRTAVKSRLVVTTLPNLEMCELDARREQVRQEREARAMAHLAQEKPGFTGRRFSMRPVWEQVA
jgi:lambda repressor-like predicted transcriptional regulator